MRKGMSETAWASNWKWVHSYENITILFNTLSTYRIITKTEIHATAISDKKLSSFSGGQGLSCFTIVTDKVLEQVTTWLVACHVHIIQLLKECGNWSIVRVYGQTTWLLSTHDIEILLPTYSFTRVLVTHSFIHSFMHSLTHPFVPSLISVTCI